MTQPFRIKNDLEATDDFICNSPLIVGPDFDGLNTTALISALSNNATALLVYDFTDNTTLRQARDGTSPVTAAGQSVGRILDLGPGAYHATAQTSDANRGLWQGAETGIVFDGVDDGYQTATLAVSGATHVQVFAGVRNLSGTGAILVEMGPTVIATNGTFALLAGQVTIPGQYWMAARGTSSSARGGRTYTPPITNVVYSRALLGGANRSETFALRVNGSPPSTLDDGDSATTGSGTFLNNVLNIGRRNASSFPFNGHLRSLIVRYANADLSSDLIAAAEQWTATRAGVTLP